MIIVTQTQVLVMRTLSANMGKWRTVSDAADLPLPEAHSNGATELPAGIRQVLLKLRKGELAAKIFDHLREQGLPEPAKSDWVDAINANLVVRKNGVLTLTPSGGWAVGEIMRDLARKFDIHHLTRREAPRFSNRGPSIHCAICGIIAYAGRNSGVAALGAHAITHAENVADAKARGVSFVDERRATIDAILSAAAEGRSP